jgi:Flp pilus assembly pilin Flp
MSHNRALALFAFLATLLHDRTRELRRAPEHGGHAVEYAIGIGLAAAAVLGVFAAYKTGLDTVVKAWVFK